MPETNINLVSTLKSYFTRIIALLLGFIAMISGGKTGKIEIEIMQPVTVSSEKIVIEVRNYSGKSADFEEDIYLEKKDGDEWVAVEFAENSGFNDIAIELKNFGTYRQSIDVIRMFGHNLETGEYKLIKTINQNEYTVVFVVTE